MRSPFLTKTTWQTSLEHNCEFFLNYWQERNWNLIIFTHFPSLCWICFVVKMTLIQEKPGVEVPVWSLPITPVARGSSSRLQLNHGQANHSNTKYTVDISLFSTHQSTLTSLTLVVRSWLMELSVWDACCYYNKLPHIQWLKTTESYNSRGQKSKMNFTGLK